MDKSKEIMKYSVMALVFVSFYFLIGADDAIENTMISIFLVMFATIITWGIIREQKKRGKLNTM